jgi:hypothetical protein
MFEQNDNEISDNVDMEESTKSDSEVSVQEISYVIPKTTREQIATQDNINVIQEKNKKK